MNAKEVVFAEDFSVADISVPLLLPLKRTIRKKIMPAVTGCQIWSGKLRVPASVSTRYGGLAVPIFHETVETEFTETDHIRIYSINLKSL